MHRLFGLVIVLLACIPGLAADASSPPTKPNDLDSPKSTYRRLAASPSPASGSRSLENCFMGFKDRHFGSLDDNSFFATRMPLQFVCHKGDREALTVGRPVRFDVTRAKWVRDMEKFFGYQDGSPTAKWKAEQEKAIRLYELRLAGLDGFAYTQDDTTGDKRRRVRHLHYCLFQDAKAVCGEGDMGSLDDIRRNPKNDHTPYALQILRSIEFIDKPQASNAADSDASGPQ